MDFEPLKGQIRSRTKVDVEPALAKYRALAPSPSVDGFLLYLRDQQVIDTKLFTELHTIGDVDATMDVPLDSHGRPLGARGTVLMAGADDAKSTRLSSMDDAPTTDGTEEQASGASEVYEVLGQLGKGAMGEVHLARDVLLRRKVALKSILPAMQQNKSLFSRFLGEMQITAQLDHPFIVPVYGVENGPGGGVAYAMKLVQGREFGDLLDETRLALVEGRPLDAAHSLEGRLESFLKVCDAMAFAHERGVIHRDLKPANIMIGRFNEVYVMDWGIARLMGKGHPGQDKGVEVYDAEGSDVSQTSRTRIGSTIGTPIYMSPEQAAGRNDELDGRSDLYALGLILQEIITLTGAVGGTTLEEVLTNAKDARRIPPRPPAPGVIVPRELQAIIAKATRLKPEERYPSVTEFAEDIRRYLRNEAILAQPDSPMQSAGRWVSKHRMAAIAMVLLTMLLGAGATIGVLVYNRAVVRQQHTRELRLAELQASSAMRAQDLDAVLQHHESQLTRMAGAAGLALAEPRGGDASLHFADEFKAGPNAVSGLVESPFYGTAVSFDWPVASLAPGTTKEMALAQLGSINSLRSLAKAVMLESLDPAYHAMPDAERQRALAETGVPIAHISLTMETGLHVEYPGNAKLAPDYDGRQEPAYKEASTKFDVVWGAPRSGRDGGVVLPCSAPLRDPEGKLLGVLMFEVEPNRAVSSSLDAGEKDYVETSLLVDTTGRVLAQKNRSGAGPEAEVIDLPVVREAMARGERGYVQTERRGHDVLVTYQPLSTVGWYVITIADLDSLKHSETPEGVRGGSVTAAPVATVKPPAKGPLPKPAPTVTAQPTAEPSAAPSAEPSASAPASAAPPPSASAPALFGKLPTAPSAAPTAAPVAAPSAPPPPNPFEPWKAYEKAPTK